MNRRKAIGGIFALAGISLVSFSGYQVFYAHTKATRGRLKNYMNLIAELVDVIIPATDTPGAKQANVQNYIVGFIENCASNKEYNNFFKGLNNLQENCLERYGTYFEDCNTAQKIAVLEDFNGNDNPNGLLSKIDKKLRGRPFFSILKSLTIEGYCTSRLGATEFLTYQPVPTRYNPITTLQPNQKAWATS